MSLPSRSIRYQLLLRSLFLKIIRLSMGIRELLTGTMGLPHLHMGLQDHSKDILPSRDIQELSKDIPPSKDIQEDSMGLQFPSLNMEIRDTTIKACNRVEALELAEVAVNDFNGPQMLILQLPSITVVKDARTSVLKTSVLCPNFASLF